MPALGLGFEALGLGLKAEDLGFGVQGDSIKLATPNPQYARPGKRSKKPKPRVYPLVEATTPTSTLQLQTWR